MKGIQTQEVHEDQGIDITHRAYKVQIEGKWFLITCTESDVLDGRFACSSNIHKWDRIGTCNEFKIEPTDEPEKELPDEVLQFISRFKETGNSKGFLLEKRQDDDLTREYPGHIWGWADRRFEDENVV